MNRIDGTTTIGGFQPARQNAQNAIIAAAIHLNEATLLLRNQDLHVFSPANAERSQTASRVFEEEIIPLVNSLAWARQQEINVEERQSGNTRGTELALGRRH